MFDVCQCIPNSASQSHGDQSSGPLWRPFRKFGSQLVIMACGLQTPHSFLFLLPRLTRAQIQIDIGESVM